VHPAAAMARVRNPARRRGKIPHFFKGTVTGYTLSVPDI
jgi:hypothetical protein